MSKETTVDFLNTLSDRQKLTLYGFLHLNQKDLLISWDFDQVLIKTEIPVLSFVDRDLGTNYFDRKIKEWNSIAKWLIEDGIKSEKDAYEYEHEVWTNPKIMKWALPNEKLQSLSYAAYLRGIPQVLTTSRVPKLAETTFAQVDLFFPWLKNCVNQRTYEKSGINGEDFKASKIAGLFRLNPNTIHLDDSMTLMRKLINICPEIGLIGFPNPEDDFSGLEGEKRIYFPDISIFNNLVFYFDLPEVARRTIY